MRDLDVLPRAAVSDDDEFDMPLETDAFDIPVEGVLVNAFWTELAARGEIAVR